MARSTQARPADPVSRLLALRMQARGFPRRWSVSPYRGRARLRVTATAAGDGRQRQVLTPLPWSPSHAEQIADAVVAAREAFADGCPLDLAITQYVASAGQEAPEVAPTTLAQQVTERVTWPALIDAYQRHKLSAGEVKPSTWEKVWQPRMVELQAAMHRRRPPADSRELLEAVTDRWALRPGARGRQIQVQQTAALLRWAVDSGRLQSEWAPPLELAPYVGRKRSTPAPTTPMETEHIRAMAAAIPDDRWRLAFMLTAAYGLRPEELQHLQHRGDHLHCSYRKVASRGRTAPRALRLLPCDGWAAEWDLLNRYRPDGLPPLRPGEGANGLLVDLNRRPLWRELRSLYSEKGEKLVPYSLRHAYAHRAHVELGLAPKIAAALMGHSVQMHLASYSRWIGDEVVVDAALAQAATHWERHQKD